MVRKELQITQDAPPYDPDTSCAQLIVTMSDGYRFSVPLSAGERGTEGFLSRSVDPFVSTDARLMRHLSFSLPNAVERFFCRIRSIFVEEIHPRTLSW